MRGRGSIVDAVDPAEVIVDVEALVDEDGLGVVITGAGEVDAVGEDLVVGFFQQDGLAVLPSRVKV